MDRMSLKKTLADLANEARAKVHEIDVDELAEDEDGAGNNLIIIDVREPDERARGYIPNSIHIPRGVLERDIEKTAFGRPVTDADLTRPIVCYCGGGARSLLAAQTLQQMGFTDAASLAGGFGAWGKSGQPVAIDR
jgi:rhodanese-related sulfurtransferase